MENLTSLLNRASLGTKSAKIMDQHEDLLILHLADIKYGVGGLKHLRMGYKSDLSTRGSKFPPLESPLNVVNMKREFCV